MKRLREFFLGAAIQPALRSRATSWAARKAFLSFHGSRRAHVTGETGIESGTLTSVSGLRNSVIGIHTATD